jgi:hypothetical protein
MKGQTSINTLNELRHKVGNDALPQFLIDYIKAAPGNVAASLAIHTASSIEGSSDANKVAISREKGLMGRSQLEPKKFPDAVHHVKVFHNGAGKAKVFYKFQGNIQFIQNLQGAN